jgi:hypothetical protein
MGGNNETFHNYPISCLTYVYSLLLKLKKYTGDILTVQYHEDVPGADFEYLSCMEATTIYKI